MDMSCDNVNLWSLPMTEVEAINFLQKANILKITRECTNSHPMKLYISNSSVGWSCKCSQKVGLRVGNWFASSRIPFVTAIRFIYCWSKKLTSLKFCTEEMNISGKTVVDWNSCLREVCLLDMLSLEKKVGGPGLIVEVDKNLFSKRKSHSGSVLPDQWVFGGICRETKETFLVAVEDISASTLIREIKANVAEGSMIYSDCWKAYKTCELEASGYNHLTVKHTYNFVDPCTGVHTQNMKRVWGSVKWRNREHRGTARHNFTSYLVEFLWRKRVDAMGKNRFHAILEAIARHFPPEIKKAA